MNPRSGRSALRLRCHQPGRIARRDWPRTKPRERSLPPLSEDKRIFPKPYSAITPNGQDQPGTLHMPTARNKGFEQCMAHIEIPNAYTYNMAVSTAVRERFAVIGEPIVAVDLINTVAAPGSPVAEDLLPAGRDAEDWWRIERARVPDGDLPDIRTLRRLRSALRETIEALVDGRPVPQAAVSDLNFFMQSAPVSTRLLPTGTGLRAETQWHGEHGGNPRLAFIATQAAEFLSDPSKVSRLRRCANPACLMIFVAVNPRRSWCAPGVCGNRMRVARHYRRAGTP
jgi:predicted RNA-binding Zn ribbon-like protein